MVEVQKANEAISPEQTMEMFLQNLAYEQVLVELTSQRRTNSVTPQRAKQIEEKAKKFLRASVTALRLKDTAKVSAQGFVDYAANLASKVVKVFRMRGRE